MGRIGRIIKSVGSGLVDFARTAEETIGDFERVFGDFAGPGEGMASQGEIMERSAKMSDENSGGSSLQEQVSLKGSNDSGRGVLPDPGNIGVSNSENDKEGVNYI